MIIIQIRGIRNGYKLTPRDSKKLSKVSALALPRRLIRIGVFSMSHQAKLKTKVIELLHDKPKLCQKITRPWARSPEGMRRLAGLSALLGPEIAELMMDWISSESWENCRSIQSSTDETVESAKILIQSSAAMELTWEESHEDLEDPFEMLRECSAEIRRNLIGRFAPEEWALISSFWSSGEAIEFAKAFAPNARRSFILAMERLKKIPAESVRATAASFANRIRLAIDSIEAETGAGAAESPATKAAEPSVVNPEKIEKAVEIFSEIRMKEREIESRITEFLSEVDPELTGRLQKILDSEPENIEVEL
jgi:hypothetical protein